MSNSLLFNPFGGTHQILSRTLLIGSTIIKQQQKQKKIWPTFSYWYYHYIQAKNPQHFAQKTTHTHTSTYLLTKTTASAAASSNVDSPTHLSLSLIGLPTNAKNK